MALVLCKGQGFLSPDMRGPRMEAAIPGMSRATGPARLLPLPASMRGTNLVPSTIASAWGRVVPGGDLFRGLQFLSPGAVANVPALALAQLAEHLLVQETHDRRADILVELQKCGSGSRQADAHEQRQRRTTAAECQTRVRSRGHSQSRKACSCTRRRGLSGCRRHPVSCQSSCPSDEREEERCNSAYRGAAHPCSIRLSGEITGGPP